MQRKFLGNQGELLARKELKKLGYEIIETNFFCKGGEIDIIAQDGAYLVFVEVRSKSAVEYGYPEDNDT